MKHYIGLSLIFTLWLIYIYFKYKPIITRTDYLYTLSYIVRITERNKSYREFVVFDSRNFKFIKSSL